MAGTVFLRDGIGARGSTMSVATSQSVVLGTLVEYVGVGPNNAAGTQNQPTVQQAQTGSKIVVGCAFSMQAHSIYESDGVTARPDNTAVAGDYIAVSQYGVFRLGTAGSSGLTAGNPVKANSNGQVQLWVTGTDPADEKIGRCVSSAYNLTVGGVTAEYVDVALTL